MIWDKTLESSLEYRESGDLSQCFEAMCALEQMAADTLLASCEEVLVSLVALLRDASVVAASGVLGYRPPFDWNRLARLARSAVREIDPKTILRAGCNVPVIPECLSRDQMDYAQLAEAVKAILDPTKRVLVVGIRTSGSYMAPVAAAVARASGQDCCFITVRPTVDRPFDAWQNKLVDEFIADSPELCQVIVLDDLAFSGRSLAAVVRGLVHCGIPRHGIVFVQNVPLSVSTLSSVPRDEVARINVVAVSELPTPQGLMDPSWIAAAAMEAVPGLEVTHVTRMPPNEQQRMVGLAVDIPFSIIQEYDPRLLSWKWRVRGVDQRGEFRELGSKAIGIGLEVSKDVARVKTLDSVGYQVAGTARGMLFYDWLEGQSVVPGGVLAGDLVHLCEYVMAATDRPSSAVRSLESIWEEVIPEAEYWLEGGVRVIPCADECDVWEFPRNHGARHFIRADQGLRRVHLELGEWSIRHDIVAEIVATGIELDLTESQLAWCLARCGLEPSPTHIGIAEALAIVRRLDNIRYWDGLVRHLPQSWKRGGSSFESERRSLVKRLKRVVRNDLGV